MNAFYDSKTKKPKPWIYVFLILIPIFVFAAYIMYGQYLKDNKPANSKTQDADIFERF